MKRLIKRYELRRYIIIFFLFAVPISIFAIASYGTSTAKELKPDKETTAPVTKRAELSVASYNKLIESYGDAWIYDPSVLELFPNFDPYRFNVPVEFNAQVEHYIKHFQTKGKPYFTKWLERSGKYMPMLKRILNENGMPDDLAYLSMIESGFNPHARSSANAIGMWQFMYWTGKMNGLRTDWWIDERRDPELSTKAASRHLKRLYKKFDYSWYIAVASYNAGEGRVSKAIKKNGTTDFWKLATNKKTLKRETRNYVPKYLAAMIIAKSPVKYGFYGYTEQNPLTYDKVKIAKPTDINVIARAAGISVKEVKALNPALRRWFTPPNYPNYEIKVPKGTAKKFKDNLAKISPKERLKFRTHRVRKGENLSLIARRYKTSVKPIMYLNNIKNVRKLRSGAKIVIPIRDTRVDQTVQVATSGTYTVRRGDTLWKISTRFGVPLNKVLKLNNIKKRDTIKPGQKLKLKEV
ncbi:MAG: LysM peptidoglycan-binding domain-containing protein [Thermodesulfobacteriota bacterium]